MIVDKSALLGQSFGLIEVEIPDVGTVKIRGLSRAEVASLQGDDQEVAVAEAYLLSLAMVEPKMTQAEIEEWQKVSPAGQMSPVVDAILKASGMDAQAPREAYADFRGRRRS